MLRIVELESCLIPTLGSVRVNPLIKLRVTDGEISKTCIVKDYMYGGQYINWNRKRYDVENKGSLMSPFYVFKSSGSDTTNLRV